MGFPGYFLIVADFIKWAKDHDIPVGPGRGSGAGSLVAYALTITDLDPLRYSLLFERFLNPERVSMPDFDIDFCMDRREEVIRYVQEKYGRDMVGQIITFGALLSKAAVRDVGRVSADALWAGGPPVQDDPGRRASNPSAIEKALARRNRAAGRGQAAKRCGAAAGLWPTGRGVAEQRLDPCRRGGDRGPAPGRAGAALSGPALGHAGDPVQHEMGRTGRAGQIRLSGPENPDGDPERLEFAEGTGVEIDINAIPLDDEKSYELYASRQDRRGVPGGKLGHDGRAAADEPDLHRGYRRAGRTLPPRPDGEHPDVLRSEERAARARIMHPSSTTSWTRHRASSSIRNR